MKKRYWTLFVAVILVFNIYHFYQVNALQGLVNDEVMAKEKLRNSLAYYQFRSTGDSLFIEGNYDAAMAYYQKADSIVQQKGYNDSRLEIAAQIKKREENFRILEDALNKAKLDIRAYKHLKKNEEVLKDSLLTNSYRQIKQLVQVNKNLQDSLVKARNEMQKALTSVGKIVIEGYNGSKIYYAGDVQNGKAQGFGFGLYNTGGIYEGEWKNNLRHGKGKYTWKDGNVYEGEFYGDKRQGKGIYFFATGEKYVGEWMDNKRSGKGVLFGKEEEVIFNGQWENDEPI
jgi:hypothetical protein